MLAVSSVLLLLIGWGSRASYQTGQLDVAQLRLSWRIRGERIESCRDRTQQELDALPVHMRTPRLCQTRALPYLLVLSIDHGIPDTTMLHPAGARHDRPIYVFRDTVLAAGRHHVRVSFVRADSAAQPLRFDGTLITLNSESTQLVHQTGQ
jgi:hypothetical protein